MQPHFSCLVVIFFGRLSLIENDFLLIDCVVVIDSPWRYHATNTINLLALDTMLQKLSQEIVTAKV